MTQPRRNWGFLLTEAALIVASILLAFAIDAWWDGRQVEEQRVELLTSLREDLAATAADLDTAIAETRELVSRSGGFLEAARSDPDVGPDSLLYLFAAVANAAFFEPTLSSYRTAVATGAIELIRSPTLVEALTDFDLALGTFDLHMRVSADLFYQGPLQDLRRAGVEIDDPRRLPGDYWMVLPENFDLRSTLAVGSAEPIFTIQRNMLENLEDMDAATTRALAELDSILGR